MYKVGTGFGQSDDDKYTPYEIEAAWGSVRQRPTFSLVQIKTWKFGLHRCGDRWFGNQLLIARSFRVRGVYSMAEDGA